MTQPKGMSGLGFKDFELFNVAMLAKQAWRLLQELDSLSARILKSIYYPSCSILDERTTLINGQDIDQFETYKSKTPCHGRGG